MGQLLCIYRMFCIRELLKNALIAAGHKDKHIPGVSSRQLCRLFFIGRVLKIVT